MKNSKKVILVFNTESKYNEAIEMLLLLNVKFTAKLNKYIAIGQYAFKKSPYIDLYTGSDAVFSSVI